MKKIFIVSFCLVFALLPMLVLGQQQALLVSGKVVDSDGNPLPGANVIIQDYDIGAATDINGNYSFKVPAKMNKGQDVVVTARFIGYHSKTASITLNSGVKTLNFTLAADVLQMDAIVVTGVSEGTPKKLLPFSVSRVSEEALQMVPQQSPIESLQGKVSGVDIVQGSGKPGTGSDIKIRGATSIGSGNSPLIVVDGIILDASSEVDIDALDVETIEVVKGAAAAALWGSRASAGVINIKTKRAGNMALGMTKIRVRSEAGYSQFVGSVNDYRSAHHEFAVTADGKHFADADGNPVKDEAGNVITDPWKEYQASVLDGSNTSKIFQDNNWPTSVPTFNQVDQFFNAGQYLRNRAEISRHMQGGNMLLSFANLHEPGIIAGVKGYKRSNIRLNFDQRMTDNLKLGLSAYYMDSWRDDPQGSLNPFYSMMFMSPMANLEADNSDGTAYRIDPDPKSLEENPLYASHNQDIDNNRRSLNADFNINWNPVQWLVLNGHMAFDRNNRFNTRYYFKGFKSIDNQNYPTGYYSRYHSFNNSINSDLTAKVFRDIGNFSMKNTVRYHYESSEYQSTTASGSNLAVNGVRSLGVVDPEQNNTSSYQSIVRSVGYYWESAVNYKEKYLSNVLIRYDGSSLFGEDQRYHLYYRAGFGWRLSQEPWWFSEKINEFKLRAAYGTAGNRPGFSSQYETFSVGGGTISKGSLGNKELKPAFSKEAEIGLEMALFDKISLEMAYSNRVTEDQILGVPLPAFFGYSSRTLNAGTLESNTIDGTISAMVFQKRDMSWNLGLTFARTREKITKLDRPPWRQGAYNAFYVREGETNGIMYGYRWLENTGDLSDLSAADKINYNNGAFQVNNDGYLVPVGEGNSWKSGPGSDGIAGTDDDLWGTPVVVGTDENGDPIEMEYGMPVKYAKLDPKEGRTGFVQIGNVLPDVSTNLSSTFRWKGLTVYGLVSAVFGGSIYNGTRQWCYRELRHTNVDQFGKPEAEKKPIGYYSKLYDTNKTNKEFVESGSYLKLREVTVSYRFGKSFLTGFAGGFLSNVFQSVSLGLIGRNLITI
ncbi:MAG TPA: SusC/RagA family TonB-linked outer membrane protein, partial [Bacteroidetes bacterium]|nr:SusC/RagA family TonB-linked outer membrane protein [Bacteroidota bacterium]